MDILPRLAKLALASSHTMSTRPALTEAIQLVRERTAAIGALVFYGEGGKFAGVGGVDDPALFPQDALMYLQQRLVQLRVPLAFNLVDGEVRFITRAANKQRRDYFAWLMPSSDSWTEMFVLRGFWPRDAVMPLLEVVESAMPALTIILERHLGAGREERLERQLKTIESSIDTLDQISEIIGSVAAASPALSGLPADELELLRRLASDAARAVDEVQQHRELVETHVRMQQYTLDYTMRLEEAVHIERQNASTDALTGLTNHRGALTALQAAFEAAEGSRQPLSVLMADVDGFKLFNDTYGHVTGDAVLKLVGATLRDVVARRGEVCRYGGDEFLVILPGVNKSEALGLSSELRQRLMRTRFSEEGIQPIPIGLSIGVSSYPEDTGSASKLVALADTAMYAAKRRTRASGMTTIADKDETTFGVLETLVEAIDAKDRYTKNHCDLVAEYAVKLAERLDLPEPTKRALRVAGLLHDVGKLVVPDEVLKKPAPLTLEEFEIMQRHVVVGEAIIREVPQLNEVLQAVACHHERFDGTGYPRGLRGQEIPLIGRIIAVADAYSAMRLDRPYRKGLGNDRVLKEFVASSGIQFDPDVTSIMVQLLLEEELALQQGHRRAA